MMGAALFGVLPDTTLDALRGPAREGSPAELLPLRIPQRLVVGTRDPVVPPVLAHAYEARARSAGDDARYVPVDSAGHFDTLAPSAIGWGVVRQVILELLGLSAPAGR